MREKHSIEKVVLQDSKGRGYKQQPWRHKKVRSLMLADSFRRLGKKKKGNRVWWCAKTLVFAKGIEKDEKKLQSAKFCKERLCPMCQWRRSIKVFYQVRKAFDKVHSENNDLTPLFLTLTVRNCILLELDETLDMIFKGWNRFHARRKVKRIVKGWFRSLEITFNKKDETFHPHIHAIILVSNEYFKSADYMDTVEWVQKWKESLRLDYDPICDIRRVYDTQGEHKAFAEVAKYTLKEAEYLTSDKDLTDKLVKSLGPALKGRRLYAYGGLLKKAIKDIDPGYLEDDAEEDLIIVDDQNSDVKHDSDNKEIESYNWSFSMSDYLLDEIDEGAK